MPGATGEFRLLARAIGFVGSAIFITDLQDRIVWANAALSRLCGYSMNDIVGASRAILNIAGGPQRLVTPARQPLGGHGEAWRQELNCLRANGSNYFAEEIVTPLVDQYGRITNYVSSLHDVTTLKVSQQHDRALATRDALTGLPCRSHLLEQFKRALSNAALAHTALATLFIDLDGFKEVNDTHGHHIGDALLKAIGARLQSAVRHSDTLARFRGDEFVILLPAVSRRSVALRLARNIVKLAAQPFAIANERLTLSASVGVAFYPDHGASCETLLINAYSAMYSAKRAGGRRYHVADRALNGANNDRGLRCRL
jgi:diguanylate cyclase (GGDEF)-like protein/PAS domain S-box-containing protein